MSQNATTVWYLLAVLVFSSFAILLIFSSFMIWGSGEAAHLGEGWRQLSKHIPALDRLLCLHTYTLILSFF